VPGVWLAYPKRSEPPFLIPAPADLEQLDPQLRPIGGETQWVREKPRDAERRATLGPCVSGQRPLEWASGAFRNVTQRIRISRWHR